MFWDYNTDRVDKIRVCPGYQIQEQALIFQVKIFVSFVNSPRHMRMSGFSDNQT